MDLECRSAVFEAVLLTEHGAWEFAGLPDDGEFCVRRVRQRRREEETTSFDSCNSIEGSLEARRDVIDDGGESLRVREYWRQVTKNDPGLRKVRDRCTEFEDELLCVHLLLDAEKVDHEDQSLT